MLLRCTLLCILASANAQTSWQKYIVGSQKPILYPKSIVSVSGNVSNPEGLIGGNGDAIFTRNEGDSAPAVVLDFGLNTVGFLKIAFNGASNNSPGIRLAFSEALQYLGDLSDYSRSNMPGTPIPITPGSDQIAVSSTPYTWDAAWGCQNGTQVCADGLHGFRYMKIYLDALDTDTPITSKTGTVSVSSISLIYSAFLGTNETFQGWFECSDDNLNKFWYGGVYTNDLTTDFIRSTDVDPRNAFNAGLDGKLVFYDGAKRDRDPYIGDVAVSGRTSFLSHGNLSSIAAKNVIADLADHQRDDGYIPSASVMDYGLLLFDYPLYWVLAANDYVLHTNDIEFLQKYFGNLARVFDDYFPANTNQESGLISKPGGYGDYAFVGRDGEASYYNALYVLALQKGAECAVWMGKDDFAEKWLAQADKVSAAINDAFWDESVGAYSNSKTSVTSHPQDANAFAVLSGVADANRSSSALSYLAQATARPYGNAYMDEDSVVGGGSQRVYAFMSTFDLRARFENNDAVNALDEIRRLYGWMYTQDPNITYWEGVGPGGSMYQGAFTSAAHGWSSGIVSVLTNYVLGVTFTEPGGLSFVFTVRQLDVTWAQGQIPTINGPLLARWGEVNSTLTMELDVPQGVTGSAVIQADSVQVTHNGVVIWANSKAKTTDVHVDDKGNIRVLGLTGGQHTIIATPN